MNQKGKIIQFPKTDKIPYGKTKEARQQKIQNTDGIKYFSAQQIKLIRRTVRDQCELARKKGNMTAIREWAVIDLLSSSGIRVSEAANFRCGDLKGNYGQSAIFVREGKGCKSRTVQIPQQLKRHLNRFLRWKSDRGEPTGNDDHLFLGQRGPWTAQAVQQIVKKYLKQLGLYERGKSVHALRHSYAIEFYSQDKDLRALQKQLGHSSIQTTTIYADVTEQDIQNQIKGLWGGPN